VKVDPESVVNAAERLACLGLDLSADSALTEQLLLGVRCCGSASEFLSNLKDMNRSVEEFRSQESERGEKLASIVDTLRGTPKKTLLGGDHTKGWQTLLTRTEDAGGIHKLINVVESHDVNKVYASVELGKAAGLRTGNLAQKDAALWSRVLQGIRKAGGAAAFLHAAGEELDDLKCLGKDLDYLRRLRKGWKKEALAQTLDFLRILSEHADGNVAKAFGELNSRVLGDLAAASKVAGGPAELLGKFNGLDGKKWPPALDLLSTLGIVQPNADPRKIEAALRDWNSLAELVQQNGGPTAVLPRISQVVRVPGAEQLTDVLAGAGLLRPEGASEDEIQRWKNLCTTVKEVDCVDLVLEASKGKQLSPLLKTVPALRDAGLLLDPSSSRPSTPTAPSTSCTTCLEDLAHIVAQAGGGQVFVWALRGADLSTLRHDLHVTGVLKQHISPQSWDLLGQGTNAVELFEIIDRYGGMEAFMDREGRGQMPLERSVSNTPMQSPQGYRSTTTARARNGSNVNFSNEQSPIRSTHRNPTMLLPPPQHDQDRGSVSQPLGHSVQKMRNTILGAANLGAFHHQEAHVQDQSKTLNGSINGQPDTGRRHTALESLNDAVFDVDPAALESLASILRGTRRPEEDAALMVGIWRKAEGPGPARVLSMLEAIDERFWSLEPEKDWEQVMKCIELVQLRHVRLAELLGNELRRQKVDDVILSKTRDFIARAGGADSFVEAMEALDWPLGLHHGAGVLSELRALANSTNMTEWQSLADKAWQAGGVSKLLDAMAASSCFRCAGFAASRNGRRQIWSRGQGCAGKKIRDTWNQGTFGRMQDTII
jgi:hypothetical protein